jgi:hypothetical protein
MKTKLAAVLLAGVATMGAVATATPVQAEPWRTQGYYEGPDSTACRIKGDVGQRSGWWATYVCNKVTEPSSTQYGKWRLRVHG